jgi:CRP-like cAMP-binding protein
MNTPLSTLFEPLLSNAKSMHYHKGETVVRAEDVPSGVYFVKEGFIRMDTIFDNGKELTLNIFKTGAYFPLTWAIGRIPNSYDYRALTNALLLRINENNLIQFLKNHPDELFELTRRILTGFDAQINNMKYLLNGVSSRRIAAALLMLIKRFGENNRDKIIIRLPLTHQDIANLAGITRETVSIVLNIFKQKSIISYTHHIITINDIDQLNSQIYTDGLDANVI